MKPTLVGALLWFVITVPAVAALKQGAKAPDFSTKASLAGREFDFSLKAALKKGPVVVYFYPSAFTAGCNIEAHTFAENKEKFDAVGATIIGVSRDSVARLNAFSADPQYCAGKFPVASDPDGAIARSYDLKVIDKRPGMKDTRGEEIDHDFTERTTFIIAPDGVDRRHAVICICGQQDKSGGPCRKIARRRETTCRWTRPLTRSSSS